MKSFLLLGPEKACYDYSLNVAKQNNWHFIPLESCDYANYEKNFFTSSLDEQLTLFYVSECHALSIDDSMNFLGMIESSPNKFILSSHEMPNWFLKKSCLLIPLVKNFQNELSIHLQTLFQEKNRDLARISLAHADPIHIFHILKFGAYSNNDVMENMLKIGQNLYKCRKSFILSMLCFALPPIPIRTFHRKSKESPLQKSVKEKLKKLYPKFNESEIADIFINISFLGGLDGMKLSAEEKEFLHLPDEKSGEAEPAVFLETRSIEEFI